jgi:hypothetical protein
VKESSIDVVFDNADRNYYWRVRTDFPETAKGDSGDHLYWAIGGGEAGPGFQTSETRMINVLAKPQLIQIALEPLTVRIQEDKTVFGGRNDNLPSNYGSGFVELMLPQVETAASYKVEIFKDQTGKSLVFSKTLRSPIYRWNAPKPGQYYWKVSYTAIDGSKSPDSQISLLKVEPSDKSSDSTSSGKVTY